MFKSCYGTIQIIRKLENFVGYRLRKHLVESLVLSKLDHCDTVYYPLPEFQVKRFQRAQLIAASFVLIRYVNNIYDIVKIGRLPVRQQRDFHVLKLVHQDSAAKLFNALPANIRKCSDFKVYWREVNAYQSNNICK